MGMLSRYQKAGGFIQLLQLIETCGKTKQDNFLQIIEKEDPKWAEALRAKMITIEKILKWNNATLAEIAARLHELTLATALHGLTPEDGERLLQTFTHTQKRNIDDLRKSKVPAPAEISSAFLKVLVEVRNMITHGYLRVEHISPELIISKDIEEELGKTPLRKAEATQDHDHQVNFGSEPSKPTSHAPHSNPGHKQGHDSTEVNTLRIKVQTLANENHQLNSELKILREKLMQIKKIA